MKSSYVLVDAAARRLGARAVEADGAPRATLVCLHGASHDHHAFDGLLPHLPELDRFAIDLPGRGGSEGPPCTTVAELGLVLSAALARLHARAPVVVLGHSFGGAIALELAIAHPQHVAGLVLLSTGARLRVRPEILAAFARAVETGVPVSAPLGFRPEADPAVVAAFAEHLAKVPPASALADWQAANAFDRMSDLGEVRCPSLIVGGSNDPLTPAKYSEFLAAKLPRASLEILPGAGHGALIDDPVRVAEAIRAKLPV